MRDFVYVSQPVRVIFGAGKFDSLGQVATEKSWKRVLVLCTPNQRGHAEAAQARLGGLAAGVFDQAVMHVPAAVARQAVEFARSVRADCLLAIGGGSTTGLAKAVALETGLPILAVPTTYAGSEMTPIYGITEEGLKRTGKDPVVLPKVVIYDPDLTRDLPLDISVASGFNAIAHAAEGLYARDGNPIMTLMAQEGIRALAAGMRGLRESVEDARHDCLYGAWLCGTVLGNVGMALHHKLCHTLGGSFDLPHAQTHAVILPHAIGYNLEAARSQLAGLAAALGCASGEVHGALHDLAGELGAPRSLRELGMRAQDLERATAIALSNPYWNPRPIEADAIRALLQAAYDGRPPAPYL